MNVYFCLNASYIIYGHEMSETLAAKTPLKYLQEIVDNPAIPIQVRADAAKALLPYTAKKTSETLETINRNYVIKDERLAALTDEQIATLIELVGKVAEFGGSSAGASEEEVQHD